jgi:hypothetical protein
VAARAGRDESEIRLDTATAQLLADVETLSSLIRDWQEERRAELRARVTRLEERTGLGHS